MTAPTSEEVGVPYVTIQLQTRDLHVPISEEEVTALTQHLQVGKGYWLERREGRSGRRSEAAFWLPATAVIEIQWTHSELAQGSGSA
jgi:hypothetical protein